MSEYQLRSRRVVYENAWLRFEAHEIVHPGGAAGEHGVVLTPAPSGTVALDGEEVVLVRQPRYAADSRHLEIVKGGAEPGESALECAQREAREELGLIAERWVPLGQLFEIPSIVARPLQLFLATGCRFQAPDPELVETVERVRLPLREAVRLALEGGIDDAISAAAIVRAAAAVGRLSFP